MGYRELLLKNRGALAGGLVAGAILDAGEAHKEKVFRPDVLQMIPFKPKQVSETVGKMQRSWFKAKYKA